MRRIIKVNRRVLVGVIITWEKGECNQHILHDHHSMKDRLAAIARMNVPSCRRPVRNTSHTLSMHSVILHPIMIFPSQHTVGNTSHILSILTHLLTLHPIIKCPSQHTSLITHPVNTHCQHSLSPIANITSSHCICDTPFQRVCCDAWKMRNQNGQRYNIPFPSITHTSPSVTTQTQTMIHSHTLSHTDTHTIACTTSCYADKNDYQFTTSIALPPPPL